jgi:hypothetical protein
MPRPAASSRPRAPIGRQIGKVFAGRNGIVGALTEDLIDVSAESAADHRGAAHTPSGAFGSCALQAQGTRAEPRRVRAPDRGLPRARHRLLLLQRRQRLDGHLRSRCRRSASRWAIPSGCIGVPKTVDNDLPLTDCCPGFGSVAKYVAVSTREAALDVASMARTSTKVFVLEVMGRHAGWIAAAGGLAGRKGRRSAASSSCSRRSPSTRTGLPRRVKQSVDHGYCVIVVSEGVRSPTASSWPRQGTPRRLRPCAAGRRGRR